jgi:LAGLIDADG DNA endonuclease family
MEKQQLTQRIKQHPLKIKKKWKTSGIKISKDLRDILHGYVMSDGYIRDGILTIDQSVKQKRFITWLYNKFQPIRTSSPIKEVSRIHQKTQVKSRSLRFFTRAILNGFHHMWYKPVVDKNGVINDQKKVPKSIDCFFNETFISIWYAGHGTKIIGSIGATFEVTSFTVEERLKLKALFLTKFDIRTEIISSGLSKKGNPQWALKIPANQYQKFRNLITKRDIIPTIFPYKLHKKE